MKNEFNHQNREGMFCQKNTPNWWIRKLEQGLVYNEKELRCGYLFFSSIAAGCDNVVSDAAGWGTGLGETRGLLSNFFRSLSWRLRASVIVLVAQRRRFFAAFEKSNYRFCSLMRVSHR